MPSLRGDDCSSVVFQGQPLDGCLKSGGIGGPITQVVAAQPVHPQGCTIPQQGGLAVASGRTALLELIDFHLDRLPGLVEERQEGEGIGQEPDAFHLTMEIIKGIQDFLVNAKAERSGEFCLGADFRSFS